MKIERVSNLKKKLAQLADKYGKSLVTGTVGYTSNYALFVHENIVQKLAGEPRPSGLGVYWGPAGEPKFLEGPAREMADELGKTVSKAVLNGKTLKQGITLACLKLQAASMRRVPVEYGFLRASAFTEVDEEVITEENEGVVANPSQSSQDRIIPPV